MVKRWFGHESSITYLYSTAIVVLLVLVPVVLTGSVRAFVSSIFFFLQVLVQVQLIVQYSMYLVQVQVWPYGTCPSIEV